MNLANFSKEAAAKITNYGIAGGMGRMPKGRNRKAHIDNMLRVILGPRYGGTCHHNRNTQQAAVGSTFAKKLNGCGGAST